MNGSCAMKTPIKRPSAHPAKPPKPTEANRTTVQLYVARSPPAVATTNLTYFCLKCGNGAKLHLFAQESLALLRASLPERRPALLLAWPHTRLASSRQPDIRCGIHGFLVAQPLRKDGPLRSLPEDPNGRLDAGDAVDSTLCFRNNTACNSALIHWASRARVLQAAA